MRSGAFGEYFYGRLKRFDLVKEATGKLTYPLQKAADAFSGSRRHHNSEFIKLEAETVTMFAP